MLSVGPVILTIRTITIVAWLAVIYDAMPFWPYMPDATGRLAAVAALAGTFKYVVRKMQRPAQEFYLAGKAMGRRELLLEQAADDSVVRLDDRRRLHKVEQGERQAPTETWGSPTDLLRRSL